MPHFFKCLIIAAAVLLGACSRPAPEFKTTDISQVAWGGDFALLSHAGQPVNTASFTGKAQLIFFGYTHCPDVCGPTLAKLASVQRELDDRGDELQVFFVTVDPGHDTPAQLAQFLPQFDSRFIGLTGSAEEIAAVAADYKVAYQAKPSQQVDHFGGVFLKDKRGKLRLFAREDVPIELLAHDVRLLLDER